MFLKKLFATCPLCVHVCSLRKALEMYSSSYFRMLLAKVSWLMSPLAMRRSISHGIFLYVSNNNNDRFSVQCDGILRPSTSFR